MTVTPEPERRSSRSHLETSEIPLITDEALTDAEPSSPAPPDRRLPREIYVLISAAFVIAIGYGIVTPVIPAYARSFDVGMTAASAVVSAFAFMRLAFAPAAGPLVNRFGERSMYITGLLVTAASTVAAAFSTTFPQLLVFRGLGGIGSVLFTVSAMGLMVRLAPPSARGKASSLYGSMFLFGGIVGPSLGSMLAVHGYRVPFLVYGTALVIASVIAGLFLAGARLQEVRASAKLPPIRFREAWGDRAYRSALVGAFAHGWANFGARMSLIPLLVASRPGADISVTGIALTVFAAGNAGGLLISGRLVDRLGRRPLLVAGFGLGALGTIPLGAVGHGAAFYALSVLAGFAAGLVTPALQALVADVVGNQRSGGRALSTYQMAQDAGVISGPVLTGLVAGAFGFGWAFLAAGGMLVLGFAAALLGRETLHEAMGERRVSAQA